MTSVWPTRSPGRPWLWVLNLTTEQAAPRCTVHNERTDSLGVCDKCVVEWRLALGAAPAGGHRCRICGLPIHPSQDGYATCVSCDDRYASPRPREVAHA